MRYISLLLSGEIMNQIEIPNQFCSPEVDGMVITDFVIDLDDMLRKEHILTEEMEIALTEDL